MKYYRSFITCIFMVFANPIFAASTYNLFTTPARDLSHMDEVSIDKVSQRHIGTIIGRVKYNPHTGKNLNNRLRLAHSDQSEPTTINFDFMGEKIELNVVSINSKGKSYSYFASSPDSLDHISIAESHDSILGSFHYNGKLYKFYPADNGDTFIIEMPNLKDHADDYTEPQGPLDIRLNKLEDTSNFADSGNEYTVIIAYTSAFASDAVDVDAYINLLEQQTNQTYINSNINTRVKIVHYYQTSYPGAGNTAVDLLALSDTSLSVSQELNNLRDQYNADIKILLVGNNGYINSNGSGECGRADAIGANESNALAVVVETCGTGIYTFGHEIGHLFGARHNLLKDDTETPFAYGHGYCFAQTGIPRTVMATQNCPTGLSPFRNRIPYWSNVDFTLNGELMGSEDKENNARVHNVRAIQVANFRSESEPGPGPEPTQQPLSSGQSITLSQSVSSAEDRYYIDVPAGATSLTIEMSGGSGDADMYVRYGQEATISVYDCRPFEDGNNEICQFDNPSAGRWYVMVRAYNPYSGATLSATVETESTPPPTNNPAQLSPDGQAITISQPVSDAENRYYVDVPAGATSLMIEMNGGSGDADMYVLFGREATASNYDCKSNGYSNNEICQMDNPSPGRWYVMIRAYNPYAGATLSATVETESTPPPTNNPAQLSPDGQAITISQPVSDAENRYYVDVPAGATSLMIEMNGGSGDADMYVLFGSEATASNYDCKSNGYSNNEICQMDNPSPGRWYVMIRAYNPYAGATLSATVNTGSNPTPNPSTQIVDACQQGQTPVENVRLTAGNAVCLQDTSDGDQRQMSFHVSDENVGKTLEIILSHGSGNGDLLHRYGDRPTRTVYDNISNNPGNEERILVHNVQRSWNYIHIRANPAFSGVTLLPRYIGN